MGRSPRWRQVVVESGHLIDAPDRAAPRFPPEAEAHVAAAIDAVLDDWGVGPESLVLTQGARGTDILVAEAAERRGAQVRLYLALPLDQFERESVQLDGGDWVKRFRALLDRCPVRYQAELDRAPDGDNAFDRNNRWVLDEAFSIRDATGATVDALVVWDGAPGDGKGGTADFVAMARERGAAVVVVDPLPGD